MAKESYPHVVGHKRVPRPSKRMPSIFETYDQFVERMKRDHENELVESCLEQLKGPWEITEKMLLDCIRAKIEESKPRPAKDMKRGPGKDIRR